VGRCEVRTCEIVRAIGVVGMTLALTAAPMAVSPASATDVHVGINIGTPPPPPVVYQAPPQLVVVPRSPVYYAPRIPDDVFVYYDQYYTYRSGFWYWAGGYEGPWFQIGIERVPPRVLAVPVAYYKHPPRHWKHRGRPPWAGHGKHHHDDDDD
jgi:hypothetical protein